MFDVIVIGGGHAGTEAAAAAARRGARTALISFDPAMIGAMSCNPAIGGLGKGHIVREVDAFDGLIARAADAAAIHHRMLNRSKGMAVRGPRVQADRRRYAGAIQAMIAAQDGLSVVQGEVVSLIFGNGHVAGVSLSDGSCLSARSVVLATGTFLGGRIFRGDERLAGGRSGEKAATRLAEQLRELGLPMARLKTGTPPRLDGRSIDWAVLSEQPSDADPWTMSPMTSARALPQIACAITRTNARTHEIISGSLARSPLFTGAIDALGPRYCPSIEDKVHRFADRDGHQIFLEPEGLDTAAVYPNGISTSLPADVQQAMLESIPGLERVRMTMPGYAVEYDHVDPRALDHGLAVRAAPGLFFAGQINGTTGYEEAAGQGLIAGLNAAAHALDRPSVVLDRASSYLGVMIDDLVLQGITEPYRMLTARAEFRLTLRADNAETRLGETAEGVDCLSRARLDHQRARREALAKLKSDLGGSVTAAELQRRGVAVSQDGTRQSAYDWLRVGGVTLDHVAPGTAQRFDSDIVDEVIEDARYASYRDRQSAEIAKLRADEAIAIRPDIAFASIAGLSNEMVERLEASRPASLAAAARIRGITPAALSAIHLHTRHRAA